MSDQQNGPPDLVRRVDNLEKRVENLAEAMRAYSTDVGRIQARMGEVQTTVEATNRSVSEVVDELRIAKRNNGAAWSKVGETVLGEIKAMRDDYQLTRDQYNRAANALASRVGTLEKTSAALVAAVERIGKLLRKPKGERP